MAFSGICARAALSAATLACVEDAFQRSHAFGRRVLLGFRRGDDTGDLGVQRALAVGVLPVQALHVGMGAAQPDLLRLDLPGQLLLLRAQLRHRRRDRGLGLGARPAARGIQPRVGGGSVGLGLRQILGQMGDFLGLGAGMHALAQRVSGAIAGHALFHVMHLPAQVGGLLLQQAGGAVDGAMLGSVLLLDVGVHGVVDRRRGHHRVIGDECDLHHVGGADGGGMQRVLHRQQRPVRATGPGPVRRSRSGGSSVSIPSSDRTVGDRSMDQAGRS